MLLAALVVVEHLALQRVGQELRSELGALVEERGRRFERGERAARVSVGRVGDSAQDVILCRDLPREAAVCVFERAAQDADEVFDAERLEDEDAQA